MSKHATNAVPIGIRLIYSCTRAIVIWCDPRRPQHINRIVCLSVCSLLTSTVNLWIQAGIWIMARPTAVFKWRENNGFNPRNVWMIKTVICIVPRCVLRAKNASKCVCGAPDWGCVPDPALGAPPSPLAGFGEGKQLWRKGKRARGKEREWEEKGSEGRRRKEGSGTERRERGGSTPRAKILATALAGSQLQTEREKSVVLIEAAAVFKGRLLLNRSRVLRSTY